MKTLDGDMIDMESYGLANGVAWHAFWIALGSAWLLWWLRRPLFLPRYKMLQLGQEQAFITPLDRKMPCSCSRACPCSFSGLRR